MTDPRETLVRIKEQADAATDGPWTREDFVDLDQDGSYDLAHVTAPDPEEPDTAVLGVAVGILRKDATFIAASRTAVPRLVGALQAVLDLHQPRTEYVITGDCAKEQCDHEEPEDCPKTPFEVCAKCYALAEEANMYFAENGVALVAYPCDDVRAITDQLGGES